MNSFDGYYDRLLSNYERDLDLYDLFLLSDYDDFQRFKIEYRNNRKENFLGYFD